VLPEEKQELLIRHVQALIVAKSHCGPIPSPGDIALYNQHIPEGADRIMRMAEKQAAHRISIETAVISEQQRQSARGQVFGLIIGLFGIAVVDAAYDDGVAAMQMKLGVAHREKTEALKEKRIAKKRIATLEALLKDRTTENIKL